jgi:hypothetical protein
MVFISPSGKILGWNLDHFIPNPFQFIIQSSLVLSGAEIQRAL